jgi:hypothetical protein
LKKSILPIEKPLQMIEDLRGVTYYWRRDEFPDQEFEADMQYGLIAQEVEKVLPELVATDSEGWKSIEYSHLVPILLEAIKEQQELIKNLKTQSSMNQQELESTKAQLTNQGVEFMNRLNSLQSRFELLITRGVEQANSRPSTDLLTCCRTLVLSGHGQFSNRTCICECPSAGHGSLGLKQLVCVSTIIVLIDLAKKMRQKKRKKGAANSHIC